MNNTIADAHRCETCLRVTFLRTSVAGSPFECRECSAHTMNRFLTDNCRAVNDVHVRSAFDPVTGMPKGSQWGIAYIT